jgi:hypothetical protein
MSAFLCSFTQVCSAFEKSFQSAVAHPVALKWSLNLPRHRNFVARDFERNFQTMETVMCARWSSTTAQSSARRRSVMDGIIYLVGLIVIVMFILSFLGLH